MSKKRKNKKKEKKLIGIYRATEGVFGFVETTESDEDIFIPGKYVNGALDGDSVEIKIIKPKENSRKAEGKVLKVLERTKKEVIGIFQKSQNFGFVVPDDRKFGTDIFISKKDIGKAKSGDKVVAEIIKYPTKGKNAEGKIIEIIGNINSSGVDMISVIRENDLRDIFPKEVINEAKAIPKVINENDIKGRKDLRKEIVFTIDGDDAKDLDDAVSVEKKGEKYILNVHIADVSNYVKEGSKIDSEAIKRGTSIYMMNSVLPMLPLELSNGICSLNMGEDRYALSCSMEIDKNGNVVSSKVYKSIIRVTERMTYKNVQKILDYINGKEEIESSIEKYKPYFEKFKLMEELANILKAKRLKKGYLDLDIPESYIELDENGKAVNVTKYTIHFSNQIIEEFMLTANETIAEKFFYLGAPFIYRVHEAPDFDKIQETNKFLFNIGLKINAIRESISSKSFQEVLEKVKNTEYEKVISTLILRTLKVATYESENKGHFGIASDYYCHFTSPIRRYPDLFIHRVISEYLTNDYVLSEKRFEDLEKKAKKYAIISTEMEKLATKAEREAEDIKKAEYMEGKIGEEYKGIVSSVTNFGMFVELENTVEGLVRFEDMGNDKEYFIYDEDRKELIGRNSKKTYKIGDKVKIVVAGADKILRKIDFKIVEEDNE